MDHKQTELNAMHQQVIIVIVLQFPDKIRRLQLLKQSFFPYIRTKIKQSFPCVSNVTYHYGYYNL